MLKEPSVASPPFPKRLRASGVSVHDGTVSLRHRAVSRPALLSQIRDTGSRVSSQPSAVPSTHSLPSTPAFPTSPQAPGGQAMVAPMQKVDDMHQVTLVR